MTTKIIQKKTDPFVQDVKNIRDGEDKAFLFCEGENPIEELLRSGWVPTSIACRKDTLVKAKSLLATYKRPATPISILADAVMEYVSDLKSAPGLIALAKRIPQEKKTINSTNPLILVLHGQQLPQNVGGMIRSAEAAGVSAVWVTNNTVDPYNPKVIRGSSGSVFRVPFYEKNTLNSIIEDLKNRNIAIVAADQDGESPYDEFDWAHPVALVVGAEGGGFKTMVKNLFDKIIRIPMLGQLESLNVGVAAAVCLFEAARQRRLGKLC